MATVLGLHLTENVRLGVLTQRLERGWHLLCEELGLFPGRKVPAAIDLVEVDEVGIHLLGPPARRLVDLTGEDRERNRQLELRGLLPRGNRGRDRASVLPVGPG